MVSTRLVVQSCVPFCSGVRTAYLEAHCLGANPSASSARSACMRACVDVAHSRTCMSNSIYCWELGRHFMSTYARNVAQYSKNKFTNSLLASPTFESHPQVHGTVKLLRKGCASAQKTKTRQRQGWRRPTTAVWAASWVGQRSPLLDRRVLASESASCIH